MEAGHTYNVFPDTAIMQGTIRSYDNAVADKVVERIKKIATDVARGLDCQAEVTVNTEGVYPPVINPPRETNIVKSLARKWFGPQHLSEGDLPLTASEDFSFYLQEKPGCFFALGTRKPGTKAKTLHTSDYDFNDDMVATGGYFWVRLVEFRLIVSLIN